MVQLFVRKDDEPKEEKPQVNPEERQAEQTAERLESREEMEKKKAEEVLQAASSGPGSAWVGDAESKLREAQASYETEKLRQDLLGEISGLSTDQIAKLNDLSKGF